MATEQQRPALDDPNAWVPYRYHPNVPAAAVSTALFGIATLAHLALCYSRRTWYFTPFIIGGLFEFVGYIGRILSADDLWALGPFIIQSLLLLVAPALFAASIYIILGRIILYVDGERYSLIPKRWLTKGFVTGDVISFLIQMGGGGIQAGGTLDLLHLGEKLIIAGLFAQLLFFGFFIVVAMTFHIRLTRHASHAATNRAVWQRQIRALYAGSILIMVRSVFRVIEYIMGNNGFLLRHEYFLYIFDAALMFVTMIIFIFVHPSQLTSKPNLESESPIIEGARSDDNPTYIQLKSPKGGNR